MITLGAAALVLALMAADGAAIWRLREKSVADAEQSLEKLNRILEEQAQRTLQGADLVLTAIDEEFAASGIATVAQFRRSAETPDTHDGLGRKIAGLPQIDALYLFDPSGALVNASDNGPIEGVVIPDNADLVTLRAQADSGTLVSEPALSFRNGAPTLYLVHRITGPNGALIGIAAAAIRLDYFESFYRDVSLGQGSVIGLWRSDGTLVARFPEDAPSGTHDFADSTMFRDIGGLARYGLIATEDPVSQEPIILAARRVRDYPLIATTSLSAGTILAAWESEAMVIGATGLIISAGIIAIAALWRRQFAAQVLMTRAYARIADESHARRELQRAVERGEAIAAEQRRTEEALRRSEGRFRDIAEFSADWIWETDTGHRFTFLSGDGAQPAFGKTSWELAGADPESDEHWRRHKADLDARRAFRGFRFTVTWRDGAVQHYSASGKPVFDELGVFCGYRGTVTNETEAILAQRRASRANRLLRDAVDSISEGFVIFDAEDRLVMCNEAFRAMNPKIADLLMPGIAYEEILRAGITRGQFPEAEGSEEEWLEERVRQHHGEGAVEQPLSEGRWAFVSERRMSDGGIAGLRIDITALKLAQVALHESQLRLAEAERIARLGCSDYDLVNQRVTWSQEAYHIFGLDPREPPPCGEGYVALVHPEDRERVRALWAQSQEGVPPSSAEYRIIRPDGQLRLIHRRHELIRDRGGAPVRIVSTLQDVTDQRAAEQRARELERQLLHSQKLEALGTMAGGIAHELNNVLGPVLALSKIAIEDLPENSETRSDLEMIVHASARARDLVRQILAFGRKQQPEMRPTDLGTVVRDTLDMLRATLPASIVLEDRLEPVPPIEADPGQLQQVIVNLVTNAAQAIGEPPGRITVTLGLSESDITGGGAAIRLAVADTGCGMDDVTASRIFEPFFTTKEADKGTGLGLSVVHGIVGTHRGRIELHTAIGVGSEFVILLPQPEPDPHAADVPTAA